MDKRIKEAVKSANSSNKLEENPLKKSEFKKIMEDLRNGTGDDSFLYSIIMKIQEKENKQEEVEKHVKIKQ
ncbi:MAG: hypothetical protein IJF92_01605 [Bacilli bacterium]|nr:hypothetical protein [Bacilli bacterium]